ncbi:MAG: MarR family transcriptional regulator [Calothrix sp. SM1_7_51]|nr:MarR family transcriptional regulator [Calothrix sp. SM1_7_51]
MRKESKKTHSFQPLHPALWEVTSMLVNNVADKADGLLNNYLGKQLGIHSKHFGILFLLNSHGPSSQIDLAQQLGVDKASMVQFLDHLEKLELAKRALNPRDRRYHVITITEKGLEVLRTGVEIFQKQ